MTANRQGYYEALVADDPNTVANLLVLLAQIREAAGDNGKRMQPELVEYIREMRAKLDAVERDAKGVTE